MVVPFTKEGKNRGRAGPVLVLAGGGKCIESRELCFGCVNVRSPLIDLRGDME